MTYQKIRHESDNVHDDGEAGDGEAELAGN
jgi:hypothetical protein